MGRRLIRLAVYKVHRMKILSHAELRKMRYGMEVIFNELVKIIILLALFAVINKLNYFLFSLVILITIRCYSGGLHFQTNRNCLLFSIIFFVATSYANIYLIIDSLQFRYSVIIISIVVIGVISPITSINRPIKSKRKLRLLKFIAVLFTVFWAYILLFEIQDPGFIACGIITIVLQASQLIAGYVINQVKNIDILSRIDNENL